MTLVNKYVYMLGFKYGRHALDINNAHWGDEIGALPKPRDPGQTRKK